jgi:carboxymethylenebutenolidase
MSDITLPSKDGRSFTAYVAMPKKTPAPTVIVIQEIFGVNAEMRAKCDGFAEAGYIAVSPDLFWRLEPNVRLTDKTEAEWTKAFDLMNRFDIDLGIEDIRSTLHTFRGHTDSTGRVGAVGYCLGGKLSFLTATRTSADCTVSYYGVGLDALLDEAKNIRKPAMLHIAEKDQFTLPPAQQAIKDGLAGNSSVTIYSYAGADHAFAREHGQHYDAEAAELANRRTMEFLQSGLKTAMAAWAVISGSNAVDAHRPVAFA